MLVKVRLPRRGSFRAFSSILSESFYNSEQRELQKATKKLIDTEINPFVEDWEKAHLFPAKEVFQKFGHAGLLGINKPVEYGGLGLDYKYQLAFLEACGHIRSGGVAMGLGVQTDCATPALARFGNDRLKREYLAPALAGNSTKAFIQYNDYNIGDSH